MLRSLNNNELMMVNGGFYYVPRYRERVIWNGSYYERIVTFIDIVQVSSGSNIESFINGVPQYY